MNVTLCKKHVVLEEKRPRRFVRCDKVSMAIHVMTVKCPHQFPHLFITRKFAFEIDRE